MVASAPMKIMYTQFNAMSVQVRLFNSVKRKFNLLPDPEGFSISLTASSYTKVWKHFSIISTSIFFDLGCGKGYPLIYAALFGFRRVLGCDIAKASVDRSLHVIHECQRDVRFSTQLEGVHFDVQHKDGLLSIPEGVTHLQSIVAWTDDQLYTLIDLLHSAASVQVYVTLANPRQQRILREHFLELDIVSVALESSGEKRQVMILQVN